MKTLVKALFVALILTFTSQAQAARICSLSDGFANLRSGPGTKHPVLRRLYNGTIVHPTSRVNGWIEVQLEAGPWGYISGELLSPFDDNFDCYGNRLH